MVDDDAKNSDTVKRAGRGSAAVFASASASASAAAAAAFGASALSIGDERENAPKQKNDLI
jgi:hypothetical protein